MLNITGDSIIIGGTNHHICQDYAFFGTNIVPKIVVADGCSSSSNTEYGSKILSRLAEVNFNELIPRGNTDSIYVPCEERINLFSSILLKRCGNILDELEFDDTVLDSTLILLWPTHENKFVVVVFGDGIIFWKNKDEQNINYIKVDCTNNAPPYLSYRLTNSRRISYDQFSYLQNYVITEHNSKNKDLQIEKRVLSAYSFYINTFDMEQISLIGISSDGVSQIRSRSTGEYIPLVNVLEQLTSFKGFQGEFVKRRVNRFLKDCSKDNYFPSDDLSIGVLLNGEQ